jgi:TrpR-related protein YerC/YecD
MNQKIKTASQGAFNNLIQAFLLIKTNDEMVRFLSDLCTPQELAAMTERWRVCRLLNEGELTYREISDKTGVSLATITRVARFLHTEPEQGYRTILDRIRTKK